MPVIISYVYFPQLLSWYKYFVHVHQFFYIHENIALKNKIKKMSYNTDFKTQTMKQILYK